MAEIPLSEQIEAVESVVKMRKEHHPRAQALMSQIISAAQLDEAKNRIERENAAMEAALVTLKRLERSKGWLQPCDDDCDHSGEEHAAFDDGVAAGELSDDEERCPYGDGDLHEAWLAGYSVGSINRENCNGSTANNRA